MRAWQAVSDISSPDSLLRVLQYNVLADSLVQGCEAALDPEIYTCPEYLLRPGSAGKHFYMESEGPCHIFRAQRRHLAWERRFPLILQEVLKHSPDIMCLQEVDRFDDFASALRVAGYEGLYCKKAWKRIKDGSAVFWRSGKLCLESSEKLQFQRDSPMKALLVHLATHVGVPVVICSTHLKCGIENEAVRLAHICKLTQHLDAVAADKATVLCGDLNAHCSQFHVCTSHSCNGAEVLFEPKVVPALLEAGFSSAYGVFTSFTTWSGWLDRDVKATFDYILSRGPVKTRSVLELPSESYVSQFAERLPNEFCPSDHVSLVADLELCPELRPRVGNNMHEAIDQTKTTADLQGFSIRQVGSHSVRKEPQVQEDATTPMLRVSKVDREAALNLETTKSVEKFGKACARNSSIC